MRQLLFKQLTFFVSMVLLAVGFTVTAQQEQVSLCHFSNTHDFGFGNIAIGTELALPEPAAAAHQAHGDVLMYVLRSMPSGETVCVSDRDGDRKGDDEDAFPDDPNREFDVDHDGIEDSDDYCPTLPGPIENGGCPTDDTDGDGVQDHEDDCPTVAGPVGNWGCPIQDTDGDGIQDGGDNCPTEPGPIENGGCPLPDIDGDGVADSEDDCQEVPGVPENGGCPADDIDRDGLVGDQDDCPTEYGYGEHRGCPFDSDGDGVYDSVDFCPSTPDLRPYINAESHVDERGCVYLVGEDLTDVPFGWFDTLNLERATLIDNNMENLYLANFIFHESTWSNVNARGIVLDNTQLTGGTRFENTDLTNARFHASQMFGVYISADSPVVNADLSSTNLGQATLDNVDFSGSNFDMASLVGASLVNADLTGANFSNANLTGADLTGANLTDVIWSNTTCPDGTLSDSNGGFCNP
jgi:hypothetical protein